MKDHRIAEADRRQFSRRRAEFDTRPETEKGMVGERRSGKDRRDNQVDRRQYDQFAVEFSEKTLG